MERTQQIRYFLFSQYLADGVRVTLEIITPAVFFTLLGEMEIGMALSLGALCVSISDSPGPVVHRRNGMFYCNIFIFIMALLTGFLNHHMLSLGILILAATFLFSMFSVYGNRAASIGTAALLMMILRMSYVNEPVDVLKESLLVLAGGIWYMLIALLLYRINPYRTAQRALGTCLHETAKYLLIKSEMYNPISDLEEQYKKLLDQQIIVSESQNTVRELLFKNRELLRESTYEGRVLVLTFVDTVDLFEHIMATWYNYSALRERFASTGILNDVSEIIKNIAGEMNNIGEAIQSKSMYHKRFDTIAALEKLKEKIDAITDSGSTIMLKKILVNIRNLDEKVTDILKYFDKKLKRKRALRSSREYSQFVTHQKINGSVLKNNLTLQSASFRHALRVMLTCAVGFLISKFISEGNHSYWIIMTIIIILKPGFSLTKQKNFDRLTGTIGGGLIGLLILAFVQNQTILFALILFFMVGTYTFVRLNYIVMVIFLTPYVLILFHFLGLGAADVASERLADTAIASVLAFLASHYLFPHWESDSLRNYMAKVLKANVHYLQKLKELIFEKKNLSLDYKLVRKELFVSTANLSSALNRMLSEPKSKQKNRKLIYEFVVLNHVLSSNIASISDSIPAKEAGISRDILKTVDRVIHNLQSNVALFDPSYVARTVVIQEPGISNQLPDQQLKEQLNFICKVSEDIGKVSNKLVK